MPERGDLVLIPFPFSDLSAIKRRPVLVLTSSDAYSDFIALPVTSRPQTDHGRLIELCDLVQGSLPAPSWIRTDRVVTLSDSLVVKRFGRLTEIAISEAVGDLFKYISRPSDTSP